MITSAENRAWPSDVPIDQLTGTGLPLPSLIRTAKIAPIEAGDAGKLGRLDDGLQRRVAAALRDHFGLAAGGCPPSRLPTERFTPGRASPKHDPDGPTRGDRPGQT